MIDIAQIDVKRYIQINNYGIQKYILKENAELPSHNSNLLRLYSENDYFSDMKWAFYSDIPFNKKKKISEMKTKILSSSRVIKAIDAEVNSRREKSKLTLENSQKSVRLEA